MNTFERRNDELVLVSNLYIIHVVPLVFALNTSHILKLMTPHRNVISIHRTTVALATKFVVLLKWFSFAAEIYAHLKLSLATSTFHIPISLPPFIFIFFHAFSDSSLCFSNEDTVVTYSWFVRGLT